MLIEICEERYQLLLEQIQAVSSSEKDVVKRSLSCIQLVRDALAALHGLCEEYPFANIEQEIEFFKSLKPRFQQWLVYYMEQYTVLTSRPVEGTKPLIKHYQDQLKYYNSALRRSEFHYQYYKLGAKEMDYLYFVRGAKVPAVMAPEMPGSDTGFGTALDYQFARFMAFELLQEHFSAEIERLLGGGSAVALEDEAQLCWTGETINLLEVAYGWFYTGQINHGKASVIDIVKKMEKVFGVAIGRPYRRLSEIRQRKRLSRTKYIDEMARAINGKMDDDDAYDPGVK